MLYYSTCAAGLEQISADYAKAHTPGFQAVRLLGGAVLYEAPRDPAELPVWQNTFLVLAQQKTQAAPDRLAALLSRDRTALDKANAAIREHRFTSFRYMFSDRNALCSVNPGTRGQLEREITAAAIDRVHPACELLLLRRSEELALFLLRLTKHPSADKKLARGELSPGTSACMVFLTHPQAGGIFCDPFAGHGSLGLARAAFCPYGSILLSDNDPAMLAHMQAIPALHRPGIRIANEDAFALRLRGVTELATDPPWGLFEPLPKEPVLYYRDMLAAFMPVLAKNAHVCILTAQKDAFEEAAAGVQVYAFEPRIDILVNGKKAALFAGTFR